MRAERAGRVAAWAAGVVLFAWFLFLVRGGLTSWFDADDLMNLHYYWSRPWSALIKANLFFWSSYYRPGGGLFYRVIYALWGFHPAPYRAVALIFLCIDFVLLAVVVRQLTGSRWATLAALLIFGVHPAFSALYFDTGTIYDVLVYAFFWAAFALYVHIRQAGRLPGLGSMAILCVLLAAALDSKEIAVLLPVAVGLYELVWHQPGRWKAGVVWQWILREGRFAAVGVLFDFAYIAGKRYGPDSLWQVSAYRPHYSVGAYVESLAHYVSELTAPVVVKLAPAMAILAAMAVLAAASRRRSLVWAMAFILLGVLPLAFIPGRGGFAYFVPSVGWAVFAGSLLEWMTELIAGKKTAARVTLQVLLLVLIGAKLAHWQRSWIRMHTGAAHDMQARFAQYQDQIRASIPHPHAGAHILLLRDPDGHVDWDVYFLIRLMYGDPSLQAYRLDVLKQYTPRVDANAYDYVLDYVNGRFVLAPRPQ